MELNWTNFDNESKAVIEELAEDGINLERLITKLNSAKKNVNTAKLADVLKEKIK